MTQEAVKKPMSPVAVAVGAIVGPLAGVALFLWVMSGFADYEKVATDFVRDAAAGRYAAAHQRMAQPYRASVPLPRFEASLARNAWFRGATSVSLRRTVSQTGGSYGVGTLHRAAGAVDVRVYFVEEGDAQKITNVVIAGANAVPSPAEVP